MLGIGLTWAILWMAFWSVVLTIIGILDPDSIDPGEGPLAMASVLGPMGLLSGVAFGLLVTMAHRGSTAMDLPLFRVAGWGILGTAVVQLAYLGHGDQGLAANVKMALLFSVFGGVVTVCWLFVARGWSHWRSSSRTSHAER